jgi:hypothetical protein
MFTRHLIAALALTTLSFTAGCAADASGQQGEGTSSTASAASADRIVEASAATRAATGIAYYDIDATGNWKAFGADGAAIATFDVSNEAGKSVLRISTSGRQVEILYSIHTAGSVGIEGTVDGTPFSVIFAKDGNPIGDAPKSIGPAFDAILRGLSSDLSVNHPGGREHRIRHFTESAYCAGLWDAVEGAQRAHEWFSVWMLSQHYGAVCT